MPPPLEIVPLVDVSVVTADTEQVEALHEHERGTPVGTLVVGALVLPTTVVPELVVPELVVDVPELVVVVPELEIVVPELVAQRVDETA